MEKEFVGEVRMWNLVNSMQVNNRYEQRGRNERAVGR